MKIDLTRQPGLGLVFKDYQAEAMRILWEGGKEQSTREIWEAVNARLMGKKTISRASITTFLDVMVEEGFLTYTQVTGKGGYHRLYKPALDERRFWFMILDTVTTKITRTLRNNKTPTPTQPIHRAEEASRG